MPAACTSCQYVLRYDSGCLHWPLVQQRPAVLAAGVNQLPFLAAGTTLAATTSHYLLLATTGCRTYITCCQYLTAVRHWVQHMLTVPDSGTTLAAVGTTHVTSTRRRYATGCYCLLPVQHMSPVLDGGTTLAVNFAAGITHDGSTWWQYDISG